MDDESRENQRSHQPDNDQSTRKLSPDEMDRLLSPDRQGPRLTADIAEKYEVIGEIARGGMGVVYKAKQKTPSRIVALKVMLQGALATEDEKRRFLHEANAAARLKHPGIVPIYEVGESEGNYYFTMEYVEGQTLAKYLETHELSLKEKLDLFQRICEIVTHAHIQGVIHRDLKPSNIMIDKDGSPRILDFGLAKMTEMGPDEHRSFVTMSGVVVGTLAYMSPEQTLGKPEEIDTRSDVYSLGVILYQMLTGTMPYPVDVPDPIETIRNIREREPKRPSTIMRILKDDLETIILKAIAKEKERRYQSAADLARDIDHYLRSEPIDARPPSAWYRFKKTVQRHKAATATVSILALVIVAAFYTTTTARRHAEEERDTALKESYRTKIALAKNRIEEGSITEAEDLLNGCPEPSRGWEWGRLKLLCHLDSLTLSGHARPITCVAFSPDDKWIATGSMDGVVKLWDRSTATEVETLRCAFTPVRTIAFNPGIARLAVENKSGDATVTIWQVSTGKKLLTYPDSSLPDYPFSPDGKRIALWKTIPPDGRELRIHDLESGKQVGKRMMPSSVAALSPSWNQIASISEDKKTMRILDGETAIQLSAFKEHSGKVFCVRFSPDGNCVASMESNGTMCVWEAATGKQLMSVKSGFDVSKVSSLDIQVNRLGDWGVTADQEIGAALAFSPDSRRIASVTGEIVKAWDIPTRNELMTLTGGSDQFMSVTFDHSGRMVASAGGPTVKVWDTRNIGGRRIMETGYDGLSLNSLFVCLSRDGKRMAFNNAGYAIRVCNIDTLTILCTIEEQGNYPRPPSISADGKRLASCSRDSMVTVWDIDTGSRVRSFTEHASPVRSAALNPDGRRLAFGTEKGLVRIFDVDTGQEVVSIESGGWVGSLAFGTDGKSVACAVGARAGARVKIWDGRSGRLLRSYPKHDSWCQHGRLLLSVEDENGCIVKDEYGRMIADVRSRDSLMGYASPDFRRFVAPYRNTYQVYDSASGDELMTVGRPGQGTPVLRALFTPDGKRVVSLDSGGTIVIWEALDWTKTPEELEQEKLERWRRMWKETYGEKKP